jgi:hypothetical protein
MMYTLLSRDSVPLLGRSILIYHIVTGPAESGNSSTGYPPTQRRKVMVGTRCFGDTTVSLNLP